MTTYRLEVGNNDGITPSNIVGAIANEADISSKFIGSIKLHDDYSTVDLPEGMPDELMAHLKKVRVCAKPMRLSLYNPNAAPVNKDNREPREKKTLSRDVENKRTADTQKPPKKDFRDKKSGDKKPSADRIPFADKNPLGDKKAFGKKKPAGGKFAKDGGEGRSFRDSKPADGSSPIKKKKTYTKKPKKD